MNIKMNKDGERIFNVTRLEAERAIAEVISTDNNLEMTDNQWWIGSLDKLKEQIIEDEFGYDDKDHTKHDAFLKKIETENDLKTYIDWSEYYWTTYEHWLFFETKDEFIDFYLTSGVFDDVDDEELIEMIHNYQPFDDQYIGPHFYDSINPNNLPIKMNRKIYY